jgi:hypothetical protein
MIGAHTTHVRDELLLDLAVVRWERLPTKSDEVTIKNHCRRREAQTTALLQLFQSSWHRVWILLSRCASSADLGIKFVYSDVLYRMILALERNVAGMKFSST